MLLYLEEPMENDEAVGQGLEGCHLHRAGVRDDMEGGDNPTILPNHEASTGGERTALVVECLNGDHGSESPLNLTHKDWQKRSGNSTVWPLYGSAT